MGARAFRGVLMTAAALVAATSLAFAQGGVTTAKPGQGGSVVQGSAGTSASKAPEGLERCEKPMGAVAVVEPQQEVVTALLRFKLQSPTGLIRMMIQQSNCFIVVERGAGMNNAMQERQLAQAGQTRAGSNMGGGQIVTADFILTPSVAFSEGNAGGVGGGLASRLGGGIGGIAGGLKFKEAQTSMLLADARSTVQVAAAEGSTKKADLRLGAGLFGGGFGAAGGGYGNSNEGKIIAAAFMDNYNQLVLAVRNDPTLQRNVGSLKEEAAKGGTTKAGAVFSEGDVLSPKIGNVPMYADASDKSKVLATFARGDEMIVTGDVKGDYVHVTNAAGNSGWVKVILVNKR